MASFTGRLLHLTSKTTTGFIPINLSSTTTFFSSTLTFAVTSLVVAVSANDEDDLHDKKSRIGSSSIKRCWHNNRYDITDRNAERSLWSPIRLCFPVVKCDANLDQQQQQDVPHKQPKHRIEISKLKKRMTAIGHFSMISETPISPSIITFFITLSGSKPLRKAELVDLWKERGMDVRHPRFHTSVDPDTQKHFVPISYDVSNATKNSGNSVDDSEKSKVDNVSSESHISESLFPWGGRNDVIERIRKLQMERWPLHESLWHIYISPWGPPGILKSESLPSTVSNHITSTNFDNISGTYSSDDETAMGESLLIFRGHHSLGDGASIGAAFMELFDEAEILRQQIINVIEKMKRKRKDLQKGTKGLLSRWLGLFKKLLHFLINGIYAVLYHTYLQVITCVIEKNPWKQVESLSRMYDATSYTDRTISFTDIGTVDQTKWIATTLGGPDCTINDVFVSCLTAALAKQLQYHRQRFQILNDAHNNIYKKKKNTSHLLPLQRYVHIAMPVHLKGGVVLPGESLGNNLGAIVARLPGEMNSTSGIRNDVFRSDETEQRLRHVHNELMSLKRTPTALLSHIGAKLLSHSAGIIPASWASYIYSKSNAGSVAVLSNNRAPSQTLHLNGRKVENFYGFVPLPTGIPVGVVICSYDNKINCTITALKWAVPDADQFLVWMLEEYMNLATAAKAKSSCGK